MNEQPEVRRVSTGVATGFAIGGLAIGIIALVLSIVPCVGALAIYPGLVAVVLSTVGLVVPLATKSKVTGLVIAALVVSVLSVLIGAIWLYSLYGRAEPFIYTLF